MIGLQFGIRSNRYYGGCWMKGIRVAIARFVSDDNPGFVECQFHDAFGQSHIIIEKIPVVTLADLWADSKYPQQGIVACHVIEFRTVASSGRSVLVDTELPWHIETPEGRTRFEIKPEDLIEVDWPSGD